MIEFGCGGWMVDFGEYLFIDMYLYNGVSVEIMYNVWFVLWVKCNYEVFEEMGKFSEIFFFMCVGFIGSQKYFIMMWVGDQNVDWSFDDGLVLVVLVVLLLVMIGYGLYYSDIGGYIILFEMKCSKELLLCWCDFSVFMLMMCIYEGNCFGDNWQFDGDVEIIVYFVCMIIVFIILKFYLKEVVVLNVKFGLLVMCLLFLYYEDDVYIYILKYQYLLGCDILVVLVYEEGCSDWMFYLLEDNWVYVWMGEVFWGGEVIVNVFIGKLLVFYCVDSEWVVLFVLLKSI